MDALCPYKTKYKELIEEHFPDIAVVVGTHDANVTADQFRREVREALCRPRGSMVDIIKGHR
jgi:hypothetical protein